MDARDTLNHAFVLGALYLWKVNPSSFRQAPISLPKSGDGQEGVHGSFARSSHGRRLWMIRWSRSQGWLRYPWYRRHEGGRYMARAPIGSEVRSRRGAIGYVTADLNLNSAIALFDHKPSAV